MSHRHLVMWVALGVCVTLTGRASAVTELVNPASASLSASSNFFPVENLVNNSGLSGAPTTANYTTITHAPASAGTAWVTNTTGGDYYANGGTTPVITLGLDGRYAVSDLVLWGYHFGSPNNNEAKDFTVEVAPDGVNFSTVASVSHARTAQNQETISLGGSFEATAVRLTITDNHFGTAGAAGGDRVGLGEVKLLGEATEVVNLSEGKPYSYSVLPMFSGGTFYLDDPHVQATDVFDTGDLTDGLTLGSSTAPTTGPQNTLVGWGDPASIATEIIVDLEDVFAVEEVRLGTHTWSPFANGAPDDVDILFSTTGTAPGDFGGLIGASFAAPLTDGHHDLSVAVTPTTARYVKLVFDGGAVLSGNTPNKWMLDEVTVLGSPIPEPTTAVLAVGALAALAGRRRRLATR